MSRMVRKLALGGALLLLGTLALSRSALGATTHHTTPKDPKYIRYIVVGVKESDGTVLFEVIESDKLKEREEKAMDAFKQAAKDWLAEQKEAAKRKEKFDQPKPKLPLLKKLGDSFKTREEADEARKKAEEAYEKKKAAAKEADQGKLPDDEKTTTKKSVKGKDEEGLKDDDKKGKDEPKEEPAKEDKEEK
jgi:hypothetical protein